LLNSDRSIRTFAFGGNGHAIFMCSPSEIQKTYLSASTEGALNLTDMLSEFFDPKIVTPQAPKGNLFKSLFSSTPFDREELCK
jgi:syntaxin-binding protein 5